MSVVNTDNVSQRTSERLHHRQQLPRDQASQEAVSGVPQAQTQQQLDP